MCEHMFHRKVSELLKYLHSNPSTLEDTTHAAMKTTLNKFCGKGQGLGNKCSDQESCFAVIAEKHGWKLYDSDEDGLFYQYQVNGTQRSIDFQLMNVKDKVIVDSVMIDLKHGESNNIFLNDGTFLEDVIYVISFTNKQRKKKGQPQQNTHVCVIALGRDIMTDSARSRLADWVVKIRRLTEECGGEEEFLTLYARSANRYSCKQFTPEFVADRMEKILAWLEPSPSRIEMEQHYHIA